MPARSISREGDTVVIKMPIGDVHDLRVALAPCPCKAPKSNGTTAIREAFAKALAKAGEMKG